MQSVITVLKIIPIALIIIWGMFNQNINRMNPIKAIKPGPKPTKPDGTPDKRRRVTPETKPKHPELKPHKHKPGDSK